MAIEVFNRYEKKYMVDAQKMPALLERLEEHMLPDKHNAGGKLYTIYNIYYDTDDDELIRKSIEKPVYKEKLRLRSYKLPSLEDSVFVEVKKKYKGLVNKRRTSMTLREAYEFIEKGTLPDTGNSNLNRQVLKELAYFRMFYRLSPKVCICYDRMAFFEKGNGDFRLTFDTNIRARRSNVGLENGDDGERILPEEKWLMEVKISDSAPVWFTKLTSELELYPATFSKYGTEYKRYVQRITGNIE